MAIDSPSNQESIQLDLQKPDLSKLQLTEEQSKLFNEYLKWKDKAEIIHLTQEELLKLKESLGTGTLKEFIEEQEKETVTSHDLLWNIEGVENAREVLNNVDQYSYDLLFKGNESIFKQQNLSEDAKRNFSTAFSLYLMDIIPKWSQADLKWIESIILNFVKSWKILEVPQPSNKIKTLSKTLSDKLTILKSIKDINTGENWEKNAIFMNPVVWLEFLKNVNISNAKELIEAKNSTSVELTQEQKETLKPLSSKITELTAIYKNWDIPANNNATLKDLKENPEMLEALKSLTDNKLLGPIFKFVLSLLWIGDLNEAIEWAHYENIKKSFWKLTNEKDLIISGWKLWNDFMLNGSNKDTAFVSNLRRLHEKWKPNEAFLRSLVTKNWELDSMLKVLNKWTLINTDSTLNYKLLSEWVHHLVWYREWGKKDENKGKSMSEYVNSLNAPQEVKGEVIQWTKLEKRASKWKTTVSWKESKDKILELIEKDWTITFKYNGKEYQLDISWFPDKLFSVKKPTIKIEWDDLIIEWGEKNWRKALSTIYEELSKKWEAVIVEDYWGWNNLIIEEVKINDDDSFNQVFQHW